MKQADPAVLKTLPQDQITTHPTYKYPTLAHASSQVPNPLKSPQDLQKGESGHSVSLRSAITACCGGLRDLEASRQLSLVA